ncbi:hypothetical protein [Tannerella sp.]|uniref:hypothetical protein n=1 Tax=Tannerella sp. TaxID=2382127 RepID=UPI003FA1B0BE
MINHTLMVLLGIFYTLAAASAACGASREEERSFWSKLRRKQELGSIVILP